MIIYFLRHASAGQRWANAVRDRKRPLDVEGIEQCRTVGQLLTAMHVHVDLILSSPLKRATQTAAMMANELGYEQQIEMSEALGLTANFESFIRLIRQHGKQEAVLVVGHNPTISRFLSLLITGGGSERAVEMKKASIARVLLGSKRSVLEWLITPRVLAGALEVAGENGAALALQDSAQINSRPKTSAKNARSRPSAQSSSSAPSLRVRKAKRT